MLMPKKTKFRKVQRGTMKGLSKGGREVIFGSYGLQAVEPAWVSAAQIEAMRVTVNRRLKKVGRLFLRIFTDKPVTKKPAETRMGKGKGMPLHWVAVIRRGKILMELEGLPEELARDAFGVAAHKLSFRTRFVTRKRV